MMEKYSGLSSSTLSNWMKRANKNRVLPNTDIKLLRSPGGKHYELFPIKGLDNNDYSVIEASDWVELAVDVLKNPGKIRKETLDKLIDFVVWFAIKGFYAEAYTALKGTYTKADSEAVSTWMQARLNGVRWFATDSLPTT